MKSPLLSALLVIPTLLFASCLIASAQPLSMPAQELQRNKKVVERYFFEIIDRMGVGDTGQDQWKIQADEVEKVFDQVFTEKAVQHFPGLPASVPAAPPAAA